MEHLGRTAEGRTVISGKRSRRAFIVAAGVCGLIAMTSTAVYAERASVPEKIQIGLLAKVLAFDRGFAKRTEGTAQVAIVYRLRDTDSEYTAQQLKLALDQTTAIGGVSHVDTLVPYAGAREVAALCERTRISVVLLSTGFGDEAGAIADALTSQTLVTVSTAPADVSRGIMVGFELVSGRPLIDIQLARARAQGIDFNADFLRLAKVIQ